MTTKKDRLCEVYTILRNKGKVHTQSDLADALRVTRPAISAAMNGNEAYLTKNLFQKICAAFPEFNLDYLLDGKGELLKSKIEQARDSLNSFTSRTAETREGLDHLPPSAPDIDFYRSIIENNNRYLDDMRRQLDNANALVLDYGSKITELNETIADLRERTGLLSGQVEHYKAMVDKEKELTRKSEVLLDEVRINLSDKLKRIDALEAELETRRKYPLLDSPFPMGVADDSNK